MMAAVSNCDDFSVALSENYFLSSSSSMSRQSLSAKSLTSPFSTRNPSYLSLIILLGPKGQLNATHGTPCLMASSNTSEKSSKCDVTAQIELVANS